MAFAASGCGELGCHSLSGDSEHEEAKRLIQSVDALDHPDLQVRGRKLQALRALPLEHASLAKIRTQCVALHESLLEAERASLKAKKALEAEESRSRAGSRTDTDSDQGGEPGNAKALMRIAEDMKASEEALSRARSAKSGCQQPLTSLRLRHGRAR